MELSATNGLTVAGLIDVWTTNELAIGDRLYRAA